MMNTRSKNPSGSAQGGRQQPDAVDLATVQVREASDILDAYCGTPIELLLAAQNLGRPVPEPAEPSMIIVTCMDHRIMLNVPKRWAFQLRTGGAAVDPVIGNIAFALAATGIATIAVIGHRDCAMLRAAQGKDLFMRRLVEDEQWSPRDAQAEFEHLLEHFAIDDPAAVTYQRCTGLAALYPGCIVAPLLYDEDDDTLSQIVEA